MTQQIPLTQGQVAIVDDWRYAELNQWQWKALWNKHTRSYYAVRYEGSKKPFKKTIYMHRQIMNTPPGILCDHRNHNTLDNQEHNLRNATRSQNQMNRGAQSSNKLGQKGIRRHGSGYMVELFRENRCAFCKTFPTLEEAIAARDIAMKEIHGEFAYQNIS